MKIFLHPLRAARPSGRAFTLVEIVLSLAIVAIALVAIIGVLPIGLRVQSDNQEESIISADAAIWMEAFRNGAQGATYFDPHYPLKPANPPPAPLFNIHEIKVHWEEWRRSTGGLIRTNTANPYRDRFQRDNELIGLLSRPKYPYGVFNAAHPNNPADDVYTNWIVYADVRALNGNMADLGADMDFAFKYRLTPEIVPLFGVSPNHLQTTNGVGLPILETNLFELRLNFQWPLVVGQGGGYQTQTNFAKSLTFRTIISGQQLILEHPDTGELLYFVQPRQYSYLTNTVTQVNP